jgi:uncharacterized protein YggE
MRFRSDGMMNGRMTGRMAVLALVVMCGVVSAEDGILVQGSGEAKGKPTEVEITATLSGDSELAADAIVKFHDAKKKALAAIEALKNPNLTVVAEGIAIDTPVDANAQMMAMRGQAVPPTQKVEVQETSRLVLKNVDKLDADALMEQVLKVVDVAKDAGFVIGASSGQSIYEIQRNGGQGTPIVVFKLPDAEALRDEATKAAVEDAKARAQKVADLAGVKLGRVQSVTLGEGRMESSQAAMRAMYGSNESNDAPGKELVGATAGELKVHVNVAVQFEIAK